MNETKRIRQVRQATGGMNTGNVDVRVYDIPAGADLPINAEVVSADTPLTDGWVRQTLTETA